MDKFGMTPPQLKILRYIKQFYKKNEYMPTVREITDAMGLTAPSATVEKLNSLEKKGYIERKKGEARAIRLL
jgi:repressor LexA